MGKLSSPSGSRFPKLPLDVVSYDAARPGKKSWNDQTDTLATSGRSKTKNMLWPVVPDQVCSCLIHDPLPILFIEMKQGIGRLRKDNTPIPAQTGIFKLFFGSPTSAAV